MAGGMGNSLMATLYLPDEVMELFRDKKPMQAMLDNLKGKFRTCHINWMKQKLVFDFCSKEEKAAFVKEEIQVEVNGKKFVLEAKKVENEDFEMYEAPKPRKVYHLSIWDYPAPLKIEDLEKWLQKTIPGEKELKVSYLRQLGDHWVGGARAQVFTRGEWKPMMSEERVKIEEVMVKLEWKTPEELSKEIESRKCRGWERAVEKRKDGKEKEGEGQSKTVVAHYDLRDAREKRFLEEFKKAGLFYATKWREGNQLWMVVEEKVAVKIMDITPAVGNEWPFVSNNPDFFTRQGLTAKKATPTAPIPVVASPATEEERQTEPPTTQTPLNEPSVTQEAARVEEEKGEEERNGEVDSEGDSRVTEATNETAQVGSEIVITPQVEVVVRSEIVITPQVEVVVREEDMTQAKGLKKRDLSLSPQGKDSKPTDSKQIREGSRGAGAGGGSPSKQTASRGQSSGQGQGARGS